MALDTSNMGSVIILCYLMRSLDCTEDGSPRCHNFGGLNVPSSLELVPLQPPGSTPLQVREPTRAMLIIDYGIAHICSLGSLRHMSLWIQKQRPFFDIPRQYEIPLLIPQTL